MRPTPRPWTAWPADGPVRHDLAEHPSTAPGRARRRGDAAARVGRLRTHRPGADAGEAEAFPGYDTLHVLDGDEIVGMLSVNAVSGAVWYHSWHGRFIAMDEPDGS